MASPSPVEVLTPSAQSVTVPQSAGGPPGVHAAGDAVALAPRPAISAATEVTIKADQKTAFYLQEEGRFPFLCLHECTVQLPQGTHTFALGQGVGSPIQMVPGTIGSQPVTLYGLYEPADNTLSALSFVFGLSHAISTALIAAVLWQDHEEELAVGLYAASGIMLVTGVIVGLLTHERDEAVIRQGRFVF